MFSHSHSAPTSKVSKKGLDVSSFIVKDGDILNLTEEIGVSHLIQTEAA